MEPCVVYGPVVVDSHHYDKQDPDPHQSDDPSSREYNDAIY